MTPPAARSRTPARRRWVRAVRARRRWIAAVLAAGALVFALEALAPPAPATTPVVVAADDLPPGTSLSSRDVEVVPWPVDLAPAGALHAAADVSGRALAGAVGRGEPITGLRLVGPALAGTLARVGAVSVPVRIADPDVTDLLRPGDRVDVVAAQAGAADPIGGGTGAATARVVASAAVVVTVPRRSTTGAFGATAPSAAGALVVLAVARSEGLALAQASVLGPLSLVLVG